MLSGIPVNRNHIQPASQMIGSAQVSTPRAIILDNSGRTPATAKVQAFGDLPAKTPRLDIRV